MVSNILLAALILLVFVPSDAQNYNVKLRNIKCKNIDKNYVKNVTCYIKAVRHMLGVLYTEYTFVQAPNVMYELKTFSRNSAGHYQPFFMNVEVDVCKVNKMLPSFDFGIRKWLSHKFVQSFPAFWKGCPLTGTLSVRDDEWNNGNNQESDKAFKHRHEYFPIAPTGDFALISRFSNGRTNKSYIDVSIFLTIQRANRNTIDLSFLNMG